MPAAGSVRRVRSLRGQPVRRVPDSERAGGLEQRLHGAEVERLRRGKKKGDFKYFELKGVDHFVAKYTRGERR
ncbi:unnamed protein product [Linum tenue]|uniref:Uncharacterized protein n=1 Tax=Linum tenue TaxID=586396 RepID=A0AAV0RK91_9ROSI|nr:unnamed protein product [Linum tenue]